MRESNKSVFKRISYGVLLVFMLISFNCISACENNSDVAINKIVELVKRGDSEDDELQSLLSELPEKFDNLLLDNLLDIDNSVSMNIRASLFYKKNEMEKGDHILSEMVLRKYDTSGFAAFWLHAEGNQLEERVRGISTDLIARFFTLDEEDKKIALQFLCARNLTKGECTIDNVKNTFSQKKTQLMDGVKHEK